MMMQELAIAPAHSGDLNAVQSLLHESALPFEDVSAAHLQHVMVLRNGASIVGCVGIEPYGRDALLRSLTVSHTIRSHGWGRKLVAAMENHARGLEVKSLYLLTTTASSFFEQLGSQRIDRASAPASMQNTTQFATLCPSSSACLSKSISSIPSM